MSGKRITKTDVKPKQARARKNRRNQPASDYLLTRLGFHRMLIASGLGEDFSTGYVKPNTGERLPCLVRDGKVMAVSKTWRGLVDTTVKYYG